MKRNTIVYFVNNTAFFVSHRLPLALEAINRGWRVILITGQAGSHSMESNAMNILNETEIKHHRLNFKSGFGNVIQEFLGFCNLYLLLKKYRPEICHTVSPKVILLGGICTRLLKTPALVMAISGQGWLKTKGNNISIFKFFVSRFFDIGIRYIVRHRKLKLIVQNLDDYKVFLKLLKGNRGKINLISGSGVQLNDFINHDIRAKENIILFPARLLRDKGLIEFIKAVKMISPLFPDWQFKLMGASDYDNPSSISEGQLKRLIEGTNIQILGHIEDVKPLFKSSSVVCLPSYKEGLPKSLIEASASGCAIVTTDVTGCRDIIKDEFNGLLVKVRSVQSLTSALKRICFDKELRYYLGMNARNKAIEEYSIENVIKSTHNIYNDLIKK